MSGWTQSWLQSWRTFVSCGRKTGIGRRVDRSRGPGRGRIEFHGRCFMVEARLDLLGCQGRFSCLRRALSRDTLLPGMQPNLGDMLSTASTGTRSCVPWNGAGVPRRRFARHARPFQPCARLDESAPVLETAPVRHQQVNDTGNPLRRRRTGSLRRRLFNPSTAIADNQQAGIGTVRVVHRARDGQRLLCRCRRGRLTVQPFDHAVQRCGRCTGVVRRVRSRRHPNIRRGRGGLPGRLYRRCRGCDRGYRR